MRSAAAPRRRAEAVLFDLDGTLVDTAPDMVAVLTDLQKDHGRSPLAYELTRSHVSNGAMGLVRLAFPDVSDAERERLYAEYLERYGAAVCTASTLFPGLSELLDRLDEHEKPWGVVTNKPARMTEALLAELGLTERIACSVSGDTLPQRKPHPAPVLLACKMAGVPPEQAIYAGDAARDIEAGRAAGLRTVAAAYGYIMQGDDPASWGADEMAGSTEELIRLVLEALGLEPPDF